MYDEKITASLERVTHMPTRANLRPQLWCAGMCGWYAVYAAGPALRCDCAAQRQRPAPCTSTAAPGSRQPAPQLLCGRFSFESCGVVSIRDGGGETKPVRKLSRRYHVVVNRVLYGHHKFNRTAVEMYEMSISLLSGTPRSSGTRPCTTNRYQ